MKHNWQLCSLEQSKELARLGLTEPAKESWFGFENHIPEGSDKPWVFTSSTEPLNNSEEDHRCDTATTIPIANAYNLSELAVMLGYTWIANNTKDAADRLIEELGNGTATAKDCNERLRQAKTSNNQ